MNYYVWVGPRESDCMFSDIFLDSICYFRDKNPSNSRKAHIYGADFNHFITNQMNDMIKKSPDTAFIFYNPKIAYQIPKELREKVLCLNSQYILELLSDKIYTRFWLSNYVPTLPSTLIESQNLYFQVLQDTVCRSKHYVVQKNKSSGGFGTFFIEKENSMLEELREKTKEVFLVSPYQENSVSVNVNAVISKQTEIIFEPSLQIVLHNQNQLLYQGADFIALQQLSQEVRNKLFDYSIRIIKKLRGLGFSGILGIDYLVSGNEVYFLEINPRFQASSFLIDKALKENNYPSLAEMNIAAFDPQADLSFRFPVNKIEIPYSFYKYMYHQNKLQINHIYKKAKDNSNVTNICTDGWRPELSAEPDAYCYSLIFNTNITAMNPDGSFNIYSNIPGEEAFISQNSGDAVMSYKISLLNQGCSVSDSAFKVLQEKGTIKQAVFNAIDFNCFQGVPINSPVNLKFTDFSPFSICSDDGKKLQLYYYSTAISDIEVELQSNWTKDMTCSGVSYGRIAYLSTDRLRLKHEGVCYFKLQEKGCYFCNIPKSNLLISKSDLEEVIKKLVPEPAFRHILIGGGSGSPETEYKQIQFIAHKIREINSCIPIYLMSLPPKNLQILDMYHQAGINEIAFNIEIFNRDLAKKLMPGKGEIPLASYLDALEYSTTLWGKKGNVRSAFIVGLNDTASLMNGIELLCQKGIQPMLSIFRPLPNTKLERMVPPSNQLLMNTYKQAHKICQTYHMTLGPSCDACKNNMLAL